MIQTSEPIREPWWSDVVMHWLENQVAIAFHTDTPILSDLPPLQQKEKVISSLRLDDLNQFLTIRGFTLSSFNTTDVPHTSGREEEPPNVPVTEITSALSSPTGKYLFPAPADSGTIVIGFFNVRSANAPYAMRYTMDLGGNTAYRDGSNTHQVVNLINHNLEKLRRDMKTPIVAAAPNWFGAAACFIHGGPGYPPSPVPAGDSCASSPGRWPINLPDLSTTRSPIRDRTGKRVSVFVLDAIPPVPAVPSNAITDAANRAGNNNLLMRDVATQMFRSESPFIKFTDKTLPHALLENANYQLITGRDINRQLYGFHMPDHGVFVAGIIRDVAHDADIECIRVLNDFGATTIAVLTQALEDIQNRMSQTNPTTGEPGDLYNKPVVINLSLTVTPSDEDLLRAWFSDGSYCQPDQLMQIMFDIRLLRSPLHMVIKSLAASGAVIVAAADNDSNSVDTPRRIGPDYPAAFPEVISVGAVDKQYNAARYSDFPQLPPQQNGIVTYGGSIPTLADIAADNVDAMRGLYTSLYYPVPNAQNPLPADIVAPNQNGWAYWSGTSFATPIISAVAARVLEKLTSDSNPLPSRLWATEVQRAITTAAGQSEILTGAGALPLQPDFGFHVSMLRAYQCAAAGLLQDRE